MRWTAIIFIILISQSSYAQRQNSFSSIDWHVSFVDAATPDSLSLKLTTPYHSDLEKVRAIFSWIAQHIAYNTGVYNKPRSATHFVSAPLDTVTVWKSGIEMTAQKVLDRRIAVCEGYAKLFKTLCDYAGIRCELVYGYAKCYLERSEKFRTNHTWNAVLIDSTWQLLDVTWASGYISFGNEFVQRIDESYFLPSPKQFILDHYPEDLRWTLLEHPPPLKEFQFSPFRYKSFIKYGIESLKPGNGVIEASVGDTIEIGFRVKDAEKNKHISPDPFFDSTWFQAPASAFLNPVVNVDLVRYTYIISSDQVEWLHLLYNEDVVLRFRLKLRRVPGADN